MRTLSEEHEALIELDSASTTAGAPPRRHTHHHQHTTNCNFKKYLLSLVLLSAVLVYLIDIYFYKLELRSSIQNSLRDMFGDDLRRDTSFVSDTVKVYTKLPQCNPFNATGAAAERFFNISGSVYPKLTPLYLNKSLNFECLNQDANPKVILFWTKW